MLVRLLKYWQYPDLLRQTPRSSGEWNGIKFVIDEPGEADYVVIHGHAGPAARVLCPKGHVWLVMGEPPNEFSGSWHCLPDFIDRAYTTDSTHISRKHKLSYAFSPWWVNKSYDDLVRLEPAAKTKHLSWITSDKSFTAGHRFRLHFLNRVREMPELDLFGSGFSPIDDKWTGLSPYRYSIAFENFSNSHYWTEKVMDCFLAWTMPIYFGCTNLGNFFPEGSFIQLDPRTPDPVGFLRDIITSDTRERHLELISEARNRVLHEYNLFNQLTKEIKANEAISNNRLKVSRTILDHTLFRRINRLPDWAQPIARNIASLPERLLPSRSC